MQRKDKGFLYLETHAGSGLYEPGPEAQQGYLRLRHATIATGELLDYQRACAGMNGYRGSPLLAAALLRPQDRACCFEAQAPEQRALQRALATVPGARVHTECADGWQRWTAHLPPPERRALVLIDPPYEDGPGDLARAAPCIEAMLQRLRDAVIALWYPIKRRDDLLGWKNQLRARLPADALCSELWQHTPDSRVALNGSGLLLVNPPWQFDQDMARWLPELATLLDVGGQGGSSVEWLKQ